MSITVEAIYEAGALKVLTPLPALPEQTRLRLTIESPNSQNGERKTESNGLSAENENHQNDAAAFAWINMYASEYHGQWLALEGDRLLAHGTDLIEVAAAARAQGVPFPLLHLVEPPREHPYIHS